MARLGLRVFLATTAVTTLSGFFLYGRHSGTTPIYHNNGGTNEVCPECRDVKSRLHSVTVTMRKAVKSTTGTTIHMDLTDALNRLLAIVGDLPSTVSQGSASKQNARPLDVCPDKYLGELSDYPFHETSRPLQNCTNARPFNAVLSILLNGLDMGSDDKIVKLLSEIAYAYPSLVVHVAVRRKVKIPQANKLDVRQHVMTPTVLAGTVWNSLAKKATTDYVLVGRRLDRFSWFARLERMVRIMSENHDVDIVGGAVRTPDGHWHMGCYESTERNYTLTYKDGYRSSRHSCAFCGYLLSPFVVRTIELRKSNLSPALPSSVAFFDYFLRLADRKKTVMSCPDVMFYILSETTLTVDQLRRAWTPVVRKRLLNRVRFPDGRREVNFSCTEAGLRCNLKAGVILPLCCVRNLVHKIHDILALCEKIGLYCQLDCGTTMGALKFNGILPWEQDADLIYRPGNTTFWDHEDEFLKLGYKIVLQRPKKCKPFDRNNIQCQFINVISKSFPLQLFPDLRRESTIKEFSTKEELFPTKMLLGGQWVNAPKNPGLTIHNRYGHETLKHVEHWVIYGQKTSFATYKAGRFKPCPKPGSHICLDRYFPDGSLEFQQP